VIRRGANSERARARATLVTGCLCQKMAVFAYLMVKDFDRLFLFIID
jgi:hypothetical protein